MIKVKKWLKKIALFIVVGFFVFSGFIFWQGTDVRAAENTDAVQSDIKKLQKKADQVEQQLQVSQNQLYQNQTKVNTTQNLINKTEAEISRKEQELDSLNNRLNLNKKILQSYIQEVYFFDQEDPIIRLAISDEEISGMTSNFDSLINVKRKVLATLEEINDSKDKIEKVKGELDDKKDEHVDLLVQQKAERGEIIGDIQEKKLTLAEIQQKISRLRSTLSAFLGKSFTIDDVIREVKYASEKTGVRKEFLFAMLDKETDLGRFTGGCCYKKIGSCKDSRMGDTNKKIFLRVIGDLGYDDDMKVSCPLSYGIGGAMGVAQFMPTTWTSYESKIASITGNDPADPWSLRDGILGMALKLKAAGGNKKSGEFNAAATYYCGSRISRTVCQNYASTVISWSKGYDEYF